MPVTAQPQLSGQPGPVSKASVHSLLITSILKNFRPENSVNGAESPTSNSELTVLPGVPSDAS